MASFLISVQWSRDVLEALAAQSGVAGPTIGQDLATRFDLGFDKPLQAWGRGVLDDGQGRKSRNRFLPFFSWAAVLDRDGHHRLGFRSTTLVFFSLGTTYIAAGEAALARRYLTEQANAAAEDGLHLIEALADSIEARTKVLYGIRSAEDATP